MEIRQLRAFKVVSTFLSFHRAAEHLNYAQSSISAQVGSLEEELGVKLFDRLGRGIRLTDAGERLLHYAEKILYLSDESRTEISVVKEIRGNLTIRIPESFGIHRLPGIIKLYITKYPEVRLSFITCTHDSLPEDLRKGITDLAFLLSESIQANDLESEALGFEHIVLVAPPGHALAEKKTVRTRDLEGETILLSRVDCSYRRSFERILQESGVPLNNVHTFYSVETLKRCVMNNAGITVLPRITIEENLDRGDLVLLNWEDEFDVAILMVWYKERWRSPALEAFMAVSREIMGQKSRTSSKAGKYKKSK